MGESNWYSVSLDVLSHLLRVRWHLQIAEDRRRATYCMQSSCQSILALLVIAVVNPLNN